MHRPKTFHPSLVMATCCALIALSTMMALFRQASAQDSKVLPASQAATGEIIDRFGDEWLFTACAGDVISITGQGNQFDPYLELFPPTGRRSIADAQGDNSESHLDAIELDESGEYVLIAAGNRSSDRGTYTLTLEYGDPIDEDNATADGWLLPGEPVSSTIRSRFGEEWAFRGCAGDVIDIEMVSEEFDAYLELYPPAGRRALAEDDNGGRRTDALIEEVVLDENGLYVVVAAGVERTDSGDYSLLLSVDRSQASTTPTATSTRTPTRTPTPLPTQTATPAGATCTVEIDNLNLRNGPGQAYTPPIGRLQQDSLLIPLTRNAAGTWIEVEVEATGQTGWVSAATQYVTCTIQIDDLKPGVIPPLPTATSTPTPTDEPTPTPPGFIVIPSGRGSPTPTPPAYVILPGGGSAGPFDGDVVSEAGAFSSSSGQPTFRNQIYFRLLVRLPGSANDGDGVDRVEITVRQLLDSGGDRVVYRRTERTAGFCSFGGGEPNCTLLPIVENARWPDTELAIENGSYEINFNVVRDGEDNPSANWRVPFVIDSPALNSAGSGGTDSQLFARVAQTGPGTTATSISDRAVFQIEAYDPRRGNRDGDGIESVDIRIIAPDGRQVYQRTENSAAYCAFSGGEPDCVILDFRETGNTWPSGEALQPGFHRVEATVTADDGRVREIQLTVEIR